jgi:hypothetical protein
MTVSVRTMLLQVAGLVDTTDVNDWENGFLKSVLRISEDGARSSRLTEKQIERLEEVWRKHFAV